MTTEVILFRYDEMLCCKSIINTFKLICHMKRFNFMTSLSCNPSPEETQCPLFFWSTFYWAVITTEPDTKHKSLQTYLCPSKASANAWPFPCRNILPSVDINVWARHALPCGHSHEEMWDSHAGTNKILSGQYFLVAKPYEIVICNEWLAVPRF